MKTRLFWSFWFFLMALWFVAACVTTRPAYGYSVRPSFTCHTWDNGRIACEAHGVGDREIHWTVTDGDSLCDFEKGYVVYLTLGEKQWRTVTMKVRDGRTWVTATADVMRVGGKLASRAVRAVQSAEENGD